MNKTFIAPSIFTAYRELAEARYFRVVAEYGNKGSPKACTLSDNTIRGFECTAGFEETGILDVCYEKQHQPAIVNEVVDYMIQAMR